MGHFILLCPLFQNISLFNKLPNEHSRSIYAYRICRIEWNFMLRSKKKRKTVLSIDFFFHMMRLALRDRFSRIKSKKNLRETFDFSLGTFKYVSTYIYKLESSKIGFLILEVNTMKNTKCLNLK